MACPHRASITGETPAGLKQNLQNPFNGG